MTRTNSTLREIDDIDITLVMETAERTTTVTGKAKSVAFDTDNHYENEYYMDTAFPRSYLSSQSAKTTVDWQFDDGKLYTMHVKDKTKQDKSKITVTLQDGPYIYEARDERELSWIVEGDRVNLYAGSEKFATYNAGWISVEYG